jgi:hypothetical protein
LDEFQWDNIKKAVNQVINASKASLNKSSLKKFPKNEEEASSALKVLPRLYRSIQE